MKKTTISIIIPSYNAEKYIEQCIQSIEEQTYKDFEIIVVNDGSKDNTKAICENLQKKYKNIIIINQENSGVSASRNIGMINAKGDYIMFVDSDDFLEKNMLEIMLKNNQNFDLIITNYKKYYDENNIVDNTLIEEKGYNKKEFLESFWNLYNVNLINSPCFRLYKKDIIKQNSIKFNLNYELGEDLIFNLEYLNKCEKIYITKECLYNYRYTIDSLTTKYRENYLEIQFELIEYIKKFLIENNMYDKKNKEELDKKICEIIISSIQNLFLKTANLTKKEKRNKLKEYLNLKEIQLFKNVTYQQKRLQFMRSLILKRRINTIILYSNLKEVIRVILNGGRVKK